ncbi:DUF1269 domain-containing protein [Saccharopolyspora oryzae]|uniref:DUF1269 domain-containing protein n=1 Tax=Saccharopolyspora oryzae TaxID=2997343 RepID=A0ABT4V647_9PSEU|nr:DUF1269 domain-containing protein [Saccharopolyspora oryzae]MDA3628869.1 DUF1269 domain-containing protein [Saccharopolyspora oryzae]
MATLTAWKFPTSAGAEDALHTLEQLQKEALIKVHDAAVVSWPEDRKRPKTRHDKRFGGALGGAFWGLLFGMIFFIPLLGAAAGAALGAVSMRHVGIDDDFVDAVRAKITPGTSGLFALTSDAVPDKVADAFRGTEAELVHTNLSGDQEAQLREIFGGADEG